jgi:hypothetical protein
LRRSVNRPWSAWRTAELMSDDPIARRLLAQDFAAKNGIDKHVVGLQRRQPDLTGLAWLREQARK